MSAYPEHDKLAKLEGENIIVGDFLEWLEDQGMRLQRWIEDSEVAVDCSYGTLERDEHGELFKHHLDCAMCEGTGQRLVTEPGHWVFESYTTESLIARYFGIDQDAFSKEKDHMLDEIRRHAMPTP